MPTITLRSGRERVITEEELEHLEKHMLERPNIDFCAIRRRVRLSKLIRVSEIAYIE